MVRVKELIEAVLNVLKQSGQLPSETNFIGVGPPLRRWTQELEIYASEQYLTDADSPPALDATVTTE